MYNNFSSKKTKKVISALLASALVVTSAPITANAATAKVVGVGKTFTVKKATKVSGLSKAEKKIVKVTVNKKKRTVTVKGVKAGKATFKIGKKAYTVKVGATKIAKKTLKTTMTAGTSQTVSVTATAGKGDTIKFASSNKAVLTVNKASAKASTKGIAKMGVKALKEGTATLTVSSKNTGVKKAFKITVKAAAPAATNAPTVATTPGITTPTATVAATKAPSVATTPAVQTTAPARTDAPNTTDAPEATTGTATTAPATSQDPTKTEDPNTTKNPNTTPAPETTTGAATTAPEATKAPEVATSPAVVATVSAVKILNLKEVQVTFTDAIPDTKVSAAENTDNYSVYLSGATTTSGVAKATLSQDKKSVILLMRGTFESNKDANKVVVKKALGLAEDYTAEKLESADIAIPQVENIEAVGNKIVKIHLSEAVQSYSASEATTAANYVVKYTDKNETISSANYTATLSADLRTVTLTFASSLASGNYAITVGNNIMKDFAGYSVPSVTKSIDVKAATKVAQATSIKVISRTVVDVTFDQEVTPSGSLTWKQGTSTKSTSTVAYSNAYDNNTLRYTFAAANVIAAGQVDFTVAGVTDAFSYSSPEKIFKDQTVVAEAIATASVTVKDDDTLQIKFSKTMQNGTDTNSTAAGDAANKANYKIVDANGKELDLTSVTATCDGTTVTLTMTDWNLSGNYTVSVSGVKDAYGSEMEALVNNAITVKDTTRPTISSATATYSTTGNNIAISFSEAMATTGANSIVDIANYQYSTDGTNFVEFPTGTTIAASTDAKSVTITLPNTTVVTTISKVKVGYIASTGVKTVADASGNILSANAAGDFYKELTMSADTAPTFSGSIVVKDATTLLVPQTGFGSVEATDYQYTLDGTTYTVAKSAKLVTVNDVNYIELGLNDTMSASTDRTKVSVRLNNTAGYTYKSKSALGTPVANGSTTAPTADLASWPFRATMKSAEVLNSTQIRITFDGLASLALDNVNPASATNSYLANYFVIDNGTQKINVPTAKGNYQLDGKNAVIITLAGGSGVGDTFDTTKTTVVKSTQYNNVASTGWATDANGVVYNECAEGITAINVSDFIVNGVEANDSTTAGILESGDSIVIKFNQEPNIAAGTVTGNIDANGIMTIAGVGKISGFRKVAVTNNVTLAVASKTLTINGFTGTVGIIGTSLKFTPDSTLKNKLGTAIKVETKSADGLTAADKLALTAEANPVPKFINAAAQPSSVNDFIDFTGAKITGSIPGTWSVVSVVASSSLASGSNYTSGVAWSAAKAVKADDEFVVSYKFTPSDTDTYAELTTGTVTSVVKADAVAVANADIEKDVALVQAKAVISDAVASTTSTEIDLSSLARYGTTVTVEEVSGADTNSLITVAGNKVTVAAMTDSNYGQTAKFTVKFEKANGTTVTKTVTLTVAGGAVTYTTAWA